MQLITRDIIRTWATKALTGLCLAATVITLSLSTPLAAIAAPSLHQPLATLFNKMDDKAKSDLDQAAGAGTSRQLEGAAQRVAGKAQRQFGEVQGKAKGTANQVEGRAKQDLGRVENAAEGIGSEIQDAAEGVTENVKAFFN